MTQDSEESRRREDVERKLAAATDDDVQEYLVALATTESDWKWMQDICLRYSRHSSWSVRAVSATCLGHLARLHRRLDLDVVMLRLRELEADTQTASYAEDALADVRRYVSDAR